MGTPRDGGHSGQGEPGDTGDRFSSLLQAEGGWLLGTAPPSITFLSWLSHAA